MEIKSIATPLTILKKNIANDCSIAIYYYFQFNLRYQMPLIWSLV